MVEEGGKVVLSSPVGERWLAMDQKSEDQPIHKFINQIHAEMPDRSADVTVDGVDLHLLSSDFRDDGEVKRKAIIVREVEEDGVGAGSMVTETVMGIKKGLATLYEQGTGTEVALNVASQFAVLEQLQGWSTGTGELNPEQASAPIPAEVEAPTPRPAPQETVPEPIPAPELAPDPVPAPESVAASDSIPEPETAAAPDPIPTPEPASAPDPSPAPEAAPDPVPAPEPAAAPDTAAQPPSVQAEAPPDASER